MPRSPNLRLHWFTPTGVGKTGEDADVIAAAKVHPHGCGEDDFAGEVDDAECGSPPRVWGRHDAA